MTFNIKNLRIGVIGLGYVGLPLAVEDSAVSDGEITTVVVRADGSCVWDQLEKSQARKRSPAAPKTRPNSLESAVRLAKNHN